MKANAPVPHELTNEARRLARAQLLLEQVTAAGFTPAELEAAAAGVDTGGVTLVEVCDDEFLARTFTPATRRARSSNLRWLLRGDPDRCFSVRCAGRAGQRTRGGIVAGCACQRGSGGDDDRAGFITVPVECSCSARDFPLDGVTSCARRWSGLGSVPVRSITLEDLEDFVTSGWWRAQLRNLVRDADRADAGDIPQRHQGRYSVEQNVGIAKALFGRLHLADLVARDPSLALRKQVKRPRSSRSGLELGVVGALHQAIRLDPRCDPELDSLLVDTAILAGARAGGILNLEAWDLLVAAEELQLREKNRTDIAQPAPGRLLRDLLRLHLSRGPFDELRASWSIEPLVDAVVAGTVQLPGRSPVFLRPDGRPIGTNYLGRLCARLRAQVPHLREKQLRFHDLRRTGARYIERTSGSRAVAQAFLRHAPSGVTDIYTTATKDEVRDAVRRVAAQYYPERDAALRAAPPAPTGHPSI